MKAFADLDRIALAEVSLVEARTILARHLNENEGDRALWDLVARSLRAWTWKALIERRTDGELVEWHGLLCQLASKASRIDQGVAARFELLSELIHESIANADISDPALILQRSHARAALHHLAVAPIGIDQEELTLRLGLSPANAVRIVNMMLASGLITRTVENGRLIVEISLAGVREEAKLRDADEPGSGERRHRS